MHGVQHPLLVTMRVQYSLGVRYSLVNNICGLRYLLGYKIHSDTGDRFSITLRTVYSGLLSFNYDKLRLLQGICLYYTALSHSESI